MKIPEAWKKSEIALNRCSRYNTALHYTAPHFLSSFGRVRDKLLIACGDESGDSAIETAPTSKEGSRCAYCAVLTQGGCASFFLDPRCGGVGGVEGCGGCVVLRWL